MRINEIEIDSKCFTKESILSGTNMCNSVLFLRTKLESQSTDMFHIWSYCSEQQILKSDRDFMRIEVCFFFLQIAILLNLMGQLQRDDFIMSSKCYTDLELLSNLNIVPA